MRNPYEIHQGKRAGKLFLGCAVLIAMASPAAADMKSYFDSYMKQQKEEILKPKEKKEVWTLGPITSPEEDAAAARQQKIDAIESLNKTLKEIDDRDEARVLRDSGVGVIRPE